MIKALDVHKSYGDLEILRGVSLEVERAKSLCIKGASGAGKSTLLHILGGLDLPSSGEVQLDGQSLSTLSDREMSKLRNRLIGFVFQFHYLLDEFTAIENVAIPLRIHGGWGRKESLKRAEEWLERVGLVQRASHFPDQLSGGERQRVAIARALINGPQILLADEPTGNLDSSNAQKVEDLFFELQKELGLTLVVVTHNAGFAARFERVLTLQDGRWA